MNQSARLPWIVGALALACGQAAGQCYWKELDPLGPVGETYGPTALVYDSARQRTVGVSYYATWEWDGLNWARGLNWPQGEGAALAYDSVRGVTVGFGGYLPWSPSPPHNQTYEWNGVNWTQRGGPAPPARTAHALAFDSGRGRTVLFGGESPAGMFGDTWEFDGATWHLVASGGPPARADHGLAFDPGRGRTVLVGGRAAQGAALNDVWEWDGAAWMPGVSGPPGRVGPALVFDPLGSKIVVIGGRGAGGALNDQWEYDGAAWTPQTPAALPARSGAGAAFDAARAQLLITGGTGTGNLVDFWAREASGTWTQLAGRPRPPERSSHAMAYDTARRRMVMDGGSVRRDHWELDGLLWTQRFQVSPQPGYHAGLAFDEARGVTVSYGGMLTNGTPLGETWEFDGAVWAQRTTAGPPNRRYPAMAYDSARSRIVMTGGRGTSEPFAELTDTWEYDGVSWQQVAAAGPGEGVMAYDRRRGVMVFFSKSPRNELWEFEGQAWTLRQAPNGPGPGYYEIAYDAARAVTVLMGHGELEPMRTWEWDGLAWRSFGPLYSMFRDFHAMAFDPHRGRVLLHGGVEDFDSIRLNDTWELVCPCYANCDGSVVYPTLNVADFACFLNAFAAGDTYANCDGSTAAPVVNVRDFGCFLNQFAGGCP